MTKVTIERIQKLLDDIGDKLKSTTYKPEEKLEITCGKCKQDYTKDWRNLSRDQRCPSCSRKKCGQDRKHKFEDIKKWIGSYPEYKLLSETYEDGHKKLKIEHLGDHIFEMSWSEFDSQGHRCPKCSKKKANEEQRYKFEEIKNWIENEPGFILLSTTYKNSNDKLNIRCPLGHEFKRCWNKWRDNHTCPKCIRQKCADKQRHKFEDIKKWIESEIGFVLLSETYENGKKKLEIKCPKKHIFKKCWNKWACGERCTVCRNSKGEQCISNWLDKWNFSYISEKRFKDCLSPRGRQLRFDRYLIEKKYLH